MVAFFPFLFEVLIVGWTAELQATMLQAVVHLVASRIQCIFTCRTASLSAAGVTAFSTLSTLGAWTRGLLDGRWQDLGMTGACMRMYRVYIYMRCLLVMSVEQRVSEDQKTNEYKPQIIFSSYISFISR